MRFPIIFLFPIVGLFCQGCVVFPYPTPEVTGTVIDATTKQPITGVRVAEIRKPKYIHCDTSSDGSFELRANHVWGPCFLIPGDFLVRAEVSFRAVGYQAVTNRYLGMLGRGDKPGGYPVELAHPIELKRQSCNLTIRGWQFEVPALLTQKVTTGPDFTVTYLCSNERKLTVGIYEGMHPQQFADQKSEVAHEQAVIDGQAASWALWTGGDTNKEYHAELLFVIDPSVEPEEVFHIFITASTREELSMIREAVSRARKAKSEQTRWK